MTLRSYVQKSSLACVQANRFACLTWREVSSATVGHSYMWACVNNFLAPALCPPPLHAGCCWRALILRLLCLLLACTTHSVALAPLLRTLSLGEWPATGLMKLGAMGSVRGWLLFAGRTACLHNSFCQTCCEINTIACHACATAPSWCLHAPTLMNCQPPPAHLYVMLADRPHTRCPSLW